MLFKKLELKNFKSYENTTINFDRGITLVVGSNGAGKSSIFEAITFALFPKSTLKNKYLVRSNKGISGKIVMEVKLTFEIGGVSYRVERSVPKLDNKTGKMGNGTAKLFRETENGFERMAGTPKEVADELDKILKMNSNTFLSAIHVRQGDIAKLLTDTAGERKELIGELLRLNDLKTANANIKDIIKEMNYKKKAQEDVVKPQSELASQLEVLNQAKVDLTNENELLGSQIEKAEGELKELSNELENLDKLKSQFDSLNNNLVLKNEELTRLNKYDEELSGMLDVILSNEEEMETLRDFGDRFARCNEFKEQRLILNNLKIEQKNKQDVITQNDANKEILVQQKENFDRYNELSGEIVTFNDAIKELTFEIGQLNDLESKRNDAVKDIADGNKKLDEFYANANLILDENLDNLDDVSHIASLQKNQIEDEIKSIENELNDHNEETIRLNQNIASTNESLDDIKRVEGNKCPTCQSDIDEDTKEKLISDYQSDIADFTKRIDEVKVLIDDFTAQKSQKDKKLDELNSIINKLDSYGIIKSTIEKLGRELEEINLKIEGIESKKEELNKLNEQFESKNNEFKGLEENFNQYNKAQNRLKSENEEKEIKGRLTVLLDEIQVLEGKLNEITALESQLSLEMEDAELNKLIGDLSAKHSRFLELSGNVKNKPDTEEKLSTNKQEIETVSGNIEELGKSIESLNYDGEHHDKIKKSVEDYKDNIQKMRLNIVACQKDLESNQKDIEKAEESIMENDKSIKKVNAIAEYVDLLEDLKELYGKNGIQKDLRNQSKPYIQKYTREFFEKFNFNYSNLTLDEDYTVSLTGPEGNANTEMVSGGEKIAIALSLRLAITRVMSEGNIETILLDEPTIHLDVQRKQELIKVLRSLVVIPQMIIVTHDEELQSAADRVIKVKKVNGISRIQEDGLISD